MKRILIFALALLLLAGCAPAMVPPSSVAPSTSNAVNSESIAQSEIADSSAASMPEELTAQERIEWIARDIIETNYSDTDIDSIAVNPNLGDTDESYILLVNLTWNVKNGEDMTKQMLEMHSEDFAARVSDETSVSEIALFWTIPYLDDATMKCSFERSGDGMVWMDRAYAF